ncbi:MAG: MFS transporter [Promethearchaeota archaeon]|nr:MAG: MFS transporter [Candidatus Lokiarchaeota archaeon]
MNEELKPTEKRFSYKKAVSYSIGQLSDIASYQAFTFLTFTYYFAVVGIDIVFISIGFIIWSFWNSFNDTLIGYLSDRTHTRWGRRIPWVMLSLFPIALLMILLFTPPYIFGLTNEFINFMYFIIIIIVFELFFTMYDINFTALYPEIFITEEERTKGNNVRQIFAIFGLIAAFLLPGMFISSYTSPLPGEYPTFGIVVAFIVIIPGLIFLKFSPRGRAEFGDDYKEAPNFFNTLKTCMKSKSFMRYIPAEIANWFVYGMLPTIVPIYGEFILGFSDPFMISLLLGVTFLSAALFMTVLWKPVVQKLKPRKSWLISMTIWILSLIPLFFLGPNMELIAFIVFFLIGIGLSGSLYIIDIIIADIVDEDEVNTGARREGGYYGVNIFFQRFATVFVFLIIGPVFLIADWGEFDPITIPAFEIRSLMVIYPTIALIIALIAIYFYPLDKERLRMVKEKRDQIHQTKISKI